MALCLWERVSNSSCFLALPKSPVSFAVLPKLAWQSQHPQLRAQTAELLLFWSCHSKSKLWTGHSPCLLRGICETTRAGSVRGVCSPCPVGGSGSSSRFQAPPVDIFGYQITRCQGSCFSKTQDRLHCWEYWNFVLVLRKLGLLWSLFKALFIG